MANDASGKGERPRIFLYPVQGLKIDTVWSLGTVELHPSGSAARLVEEARQARAAWGDSQAPSAHQEFVDQRVTDNFTDFAVARIDAHDAKWGYERVADALGVLRLFAAWRSPMTNNERQSFGLAGELPYSTAEYIDLTAGPALGWFREGPVPWSEFTSTDYKSFQNSPGAQFLVSCFELSSRSASALQGRARLGQRLLNNAILDQDPDRKVVSLVLGLEVLFAEREWQGKGYGMARRIAFMTCSVPHRSMCGRDRPSCPYLALDPSKKPPKELEDLVAHPSVQDGTWCARYLEVMQLYKWRNDAVHEGSCHATWEDVRNLGWPLYSWLLPTFFDWCAAHPDGDLVMLDAEIQQAVANRPPPHPAGLSKVP